MTRDHELLLNLGKVETSINIRLSIRQLFFCPQHLSLKMINLRTSGLVSGVNFVFTHFNMQLATSVCIPSCQTHVFLFFSKFLDAKVKI